MTGTLCQPSQPDAQQLATWEDVARLKDEGRLVFVVQDRVYCVDDDFLHPGGNSVSSASMRFGCIAKPKNSNSIKLFR
jgi:hypothetical protein